MARTIKMDMTNGNTLKKLFLFALPFIAMNVLQNLFNLADVAVVGMFVDDVAVAAVGCNGTIINLLVSLFVGMSVASNIIIAKLVGGKDTKDVNKVIGTSLSLSVVFGVILTTIGVTLARRFLIWTDCAESVLDQATIYLRIYFLSVPFLLIYNFSASILRAYGDTFHPMIFIVIAGIINVFLNVFLVVVCGLSVAGVAIATSVSQTFSAVACLITVLKRKGDYVLKKSDFKIDTKTLKEIIRLGLPSGIQGSLFAVSNIIIQTATNSFGQELMSANSIANQLDNILFAMGDAIAVSSISFVSQNYGAGKFKRIVQTIFSAFFLIFMVEVVMVVMILIFGRDFVMIFTSTESVIELALLKLNLLCPCYMFCNMMGVMANTFKGLGKPVTAMVIVLIGSCLARILYIKFILPIYNTVYALFMVYPITWGLTLIILTAFLIPALKKVKKEIGDSKEEKEEVVMTEKIA